MRKILAVFGFAMWCGYAPTVHAGYGSCYEVPPICIGTHPQCMCNQYNQCFWACR